MMPLPASAKCTVVDRLPVFFSSKFISCFVIFFSSSAEGTTTLKGHRRGSIFALRSFSSKGETASVDGMGMGLCLLLLLLFLPPSILHRCFLHDALLNYGGERKERGKEKTRNGPVKSEAVFFSHRTNEKALLLLPSLSSHTWTCQNDSSKGKGRRGGRRQREELLSLLKEIFGLDCEMSHRN